MENTPPEAIFTPRPERLPEGNLEGRGVQIGKGAFFPIHPDSRQCIAILFSRAGVYWKLPFKQPGCISSIQIQYTPPL